MKKLFTLMLAFALLLSLAACNQEAPATTPAATSDPTVVLPTYEETANPVTYFSMSYGKNAQEVRYISVSANEDGTAAVDYTGEERKVADFDATMFHGIADELKKTGLADLNGKDALEEGEASGSMYIEFEDATTLAVTYNGTVPEAFIQGFEVMDAFFAEATRELPVYVPQPMILGEVGQTQLEVVNSILSGSGLEHLDSYTISAIEKGEDFAYAAGLTDDTGIVSAVSFAPMMITSAYSMVIVTLEEDADAEAVCKDFESNIDWRKWVCVVPTDALIATKDNMVLCLVGSDSIFTQTATGITAAGWTTVKTLKNQ